MDELIIFAPNFIPFTRSESTATEKLRRANELSSKPCHKFLDVYLIAVVGLKLR